MEDIKTSDRGIEIRVWMVRKQIKQSNLVRELGVTPSALPHWIDGHFKSKRIEKIFVAKGCPKGLLGEK